MRRSIVSESRRRQEDAIDDEDQPIVPARSSAVLARDDLAPIPLTTLYPTVSNLQRHGVAVGNPLENTNNNNAHHQALISDDEVDIVVTRRPNEIALPPRQELRRLFSEVTMPADLQSFDGSEFEKIPTTDDYMDDDELELYLSQLAKEEEQKSKERESIKQIMEQDQLDLLLMQMEGSGANMEEDLNRLLEEQIQVEQQYTNESAAKRISQSFC